ncbi:uncharacterized protein LOC129565731 [Sitodiplosis mosellana]|uniref:uncharacterized protein LOC129565731 n=1 Tax=Sitodiplosis mosellana TaxID=263140 RepID=UPI00244436E6|nr:uncharacterized protein LOC129565731 [Sitodiplosis mosellana]
MKSVFLLALCVFIICGVGASLSKRGPFTLEANNNNKKGISADIGDDIGDLGCSICKDVTVFAKKQISEDTKKDIITTLQNVCKSVLSFFETFCNELVKMEDTDIESLIKSDPEAICKQIGLC